MQDHSQINIYIYIYTHRFQFLVYSGLAQARPELGGGMLVSSPDPTLCKGKGLVRVERFLGFCKLSSHVFA